MSGPARAYYNEIDPFAAAWLRELIDAGHIAPGEVDTRSILDVRPDDLRDFAQCHFFAGIGVWSYALRRAGWSDDRPIWTGSCPCQPFSAAGKGGGFADERHLWPAFFHLIRERRPDVVLGEQVASKDGLGWLDLVCADLEGENYAVGAVDTCSAGHGAPHIRQRLRFAAKRLGDANLCFGGQRDSLGRGRFDRGDEVERPGSGSYGVLVGVALDDGDRCHQARRDLAAPGHDGFVGDGSAGRLDHHHHHQRLEGFGEGHRGPIGHRQEPFRSTSQTSEFSGVVNASGNGRGESGNRHHAEHDRPQLDADACDDRSGPTNGFWRDADWLFCRDGKWRPVEPGSFPLAHGAPARVGRLRGYGNAIDAEATTSFIEAYLDIETIAGEAAHAV